MRGVNLTTLATILLISAALYIWTVDIVSTDYTPLDAGMFGQLVLSVSKVDLIDASQANLPWAGETWLITLVASPQEAESIIARLGYIEQTIPKEQISADFKQAQYDVKIRITPVTQQCIYGPDFTTYKRAVPVKALYKEFDLGTGLLCPYNSISEWTKFPAEYEEKNLAMYDDVAWHCAYFCTGFPKQAWVSCVFLAESIDPTIGTAKMTIKSLYVKDRITVTAGYKTASGEATDKIETTSASPSAILKYGTSIIGKVDLVGFLKASDYCPEGANYYLFNNGQGWKIVPETLYNDFYFYVRQLETGTLYIPECEDLSSLDQFKSCKAELKRIADTINTYISAINQRAPIIEGKVATRPEAAEYSAAYYFAITPDKPVVYGMYRMYLKADWVGILVSTAKPRVASISPTTVELVGPEEKQVSVIVNNTGDEGGIITKVYCTNNFLVDGKTESSRADTFKPNESRTYTFGISYGGLGTEAASGTCTVEAISSANPNIKSTGTFTVKFTPRGIYPPNTTVCISTSAYAKTDANGNIIKGTEKTCPSGTYCKDTPTGAVCEEEKIPTPQPQPQPQPDLGTILIAAAVGFFIILAVVIALTM